MLLLKSKVHRVMDKWEREVLTHLFHKLCEIVEHSSSGGRVVMRKMRRLEQIYQQVFDERREQGLSRIHDEDAEKASERMGIFTEVGTYLASDFSFFIDLLPAFQIPEALGLVLDAGSGLGRFALMLAILKPEIKKIVGIEYNQLLYQESRSALKRSVQENLVRKRQVEFHLGDFNDFKFAPFFQQADFVYYYQGGTDRVDRMVRTLLCHMKPGACFIFYSPTDPNPNPFALLSENNHFTHLEATTVPIYKRRECDDDKTRKPRV